MWTGVLDDVVGEVICLAIDDAAFHAPAGHPEAIATRMMVASVIGRRQPALRVDGPPELATPNDERLVEEAAVLEILNESPRRAVDISGLGREDLGCERVDIPATVIDLDESHTPLDQPPGHQHRILKFSRLFRFFTPTFEGALGLAREVSHLGHRGLHSKRHFVLLDACKCFGVTNQLVLDPIELTESVKHFSPDGSRYAVRIPYVEHRVRTRAEPHAGVFR